MSSQFRLGIILNSLLHQPNYCHHRLQFHVLGHHLILVCKLTDFLFKSILFQHSCNHLLSRHYYLCSRRLMLGLMLRRAYCRLIFLCKLLGHCGLSSIQFLVFMCLSIRRLLLYHHHLTVLCLFSCYRRIPPITLKDYLCKRNLSLSSYNLLSTHPRLLCSRRLMLGLMLRRAYCRLIFLCKLLGHCGLSSIQFLVFMCLSIRRLLLYHHHLTVLCLFSCYRRIQSDHTEGLPVQA